MTHRRFFYSMLLVIAAGTITVLLLNFIVDPWNIYGAVKRKGFNLYKTTYSSYVMIAKPAQIARRKPEQLAIGSSRVFVGIPVDDAAWNKGTGFNAGVNGATLRTAADLLEHAIATGAPRDVLVTTDLFMFNALSLKPYAHPLATLQEHQLARLQRELSMEQQYLFSSAVTRASLETLRKQKEKYNKYRDSGQVNPDHETSRSLESGYEQRFIQFEDASTRLAWSRCRDNRLPFEAGGQSAAAQLDRLFELAAGHDIRLRLVISPIHARLLETMDAAGLWVHFENMKRLLVERSEMARKTHPALDVAVWDFSGYNRYTTEELPAAAGLTMQWYHDASHFNEALGRLMLSSIYGAQPDAGFGVVLDEGSLEQHLAALRADQRRYRDQHAAQYAEISNRVHTILEEKKRFGDRCDTQEASQP